MTLTLFVTDNCKSCERVTRQISELIRGKGGISFTIENINFYNSKNIIVVPALFVNDELYSYGDINKSRLLKLIEGIA